MECRARLEAIRCVSSACAEHSEGCNRPRQTEIMIRQFPRVITAKRARAASQLTLAKLLLRLKAMVVPNKELIMRSIVGLIGFAIGTGFSWSAGKSVAVRGVSGPRWRDSARRPSPALVGTTLDQVPGPVAPGTPGRTAAKARADATPTNPAKK